MVNLSIATDENYIGRGGGSASRGSTATSAMITPAEKTSVFLVL